MSFRGPVVDFNRFDDVDPEETQEWLESIDSVLQAHGPDRAHFLLNSMIDHARRSGAYLPYSATTAYLNTIPVAQQPEYPGDRAIERRIEAYIRWNAMAMVVQANRKQSRVRWTYFATMHLRRPCTKSASITSGVRRRKRMAVTWFICRAIRRRASTREPFSKDA